MKARLSAIMGRRLRGREPRPPIVLLGTGGSGTRAIAELLLEAGVYLGPKRNRASDSLELKPFLVRWSQPYVRESGWVQAVERGGQAEVSPPPAEIVDELGIALRSQRRGIPSPGSLWGWKNPRTTNLLPVLNEVAPDAATAHLVRDGRDMAYSKNQNQLEDCEPLIPEELEDAPEPVRSIYLWSRVNLAALAYMRELKGDRHLVVRYEDLCADPREHAERLLSHLGVPATKRLLTRATELISLSPSAGRWRDAPPETARAVEEAGAPALREFGYL